MSHRKLGARNMIVMSNFRPEVEMSQVCACALKNVQYNLIYGRIAKIPASYRKSGSRNTMVTQLWGRYHVPQNIFLVISLVFVDVSTPSSSISNYVE